MKVIKRVEKKLLFGISIIPIVIFTGTFGYMAIEGWNFFDSFYMTIITISTTGYNEVHDLSMKGRVLSVFLIFSGVTTLAYAGGRAVQLLLETQLLRRRRMKQKIESLKDHYIVCGYGRMGKYICEGLKYFKHPFVVVENNQDLIESLDEEGLLYLIGDASRDEILLQAGIKQAKGLVAVVATDAENVFTTLSAKQLNPEIFVVARAVEEETASKLHKAGADRVVKPYELGGNRMVQLLLRPGVSDFIDVIARKRGMDINLEEIEVSSNSTLVGVTLANSSIRSELDIMIVAISANGKDFIYNPTSSYEIKAGDRLIAIGETSNLNKLTDLCVVD